MALKIGNNAVANAFIGSSQVRRAYKGGTLVYQGFGPASEQEFIQQEAAGGPAKLLKCYGKTIVNNQLANPTATGGSGITIVKNSDGSFTLNGTVTTTVNLMHSYCSVVNNHIYVLDASILSEGSNTELSGILGQAYAAGLINISTYKTTPVVMATAHGDGSGVDIRWHFTAGDVYDNVRVRLCLIDLTLLYGAGNEPSTAEQFLADYPAFDPTYDPGSLQSNNTAELRAERIPVINVWDEEWEPGSINYTTGQETSPAGYFRSKSYIPVSPGDTLYITNPNAANISFYDKDKIFFNTGMSYINKQNTTFIVPNNAAFLRFATAGTTYQNDICINLSDPAINGQYFPHWRGSLALNLSTLTSGGVAVFPDGLRGVGTDRDAAYGSTGEVRLGKRAYQTGDESDTSVLTDGTNTIYPLATPLTYTLDTPLPTDLTCEQGDILQRVSDNNCPFVGEMKFGL